MKNVASTTIALALAALCSIFSGCATNQSKFTASTVEEIKSGMTKGEVVKKVGEPRSRLTDTEGNQVWEYRKNGSEGKGAKTFSDIYSFGFTANKDAEFQDILTVVFKDDVVLKATYQENVQMLNRLLKQ